MLRLDNWGSQARFGMFIVSSEAVPEAEWWAMLPPHISVHASRIDAPAPWATWQRESHTKDGSGAVTLAHDLARGAGHFASMRLNAVVVGHTSSSIIGGAGWDDAVVTELRNSLSDEVNVTTNGLDCRAALRACSVERPFLVFPPWFDKSLVNAGVHYFSSHGFEPSGSLCVDPGHRWRDLPPAQLYPQGIGFEQDAGYLYRQILEAIPADADSVLIAGTGFRCVGIIHALESKISRPVVTANQASLWHCLRMSGVSATVSGYGKLLELP